LQATCPVHPLPPWNNYHHFSPFFHGFGTNCMVPTDWDLARAACSTLGALACIQAFKRQRARFLNERLSLESQASHTKHPCLPRMVTIARMLSMSRYMYSICVVGGAPHVETRSPMPVWSTPGPGSSVCACVYREHIAQATGGRFPCQGVAYYVKNTSGILDPYGRKRHIIRTKLFVDCHEIWTRWLAPPPFSHPDSLKCWQWGFFRID